MPRLKSSGICMYKIRRWSFNLLGSLNQYPDHLFILMYSYFCLSNDLSALNSLHLYCNLYRLFRSSILFLSNVLSRVYISVLSFSVCFVFTIQFQFLILIPIYLLPILRISSICPNSSASKGYCSLYVPFVFNFLQSMMCVVLICLLVIILVVKWR